MTNDFYKTIRKFKQASFLRTLHVKLQILFLFLFGHRTQRGQG